MPSAALRLWQTDRLPRLLLVDAQGAAVEAAAAPNARLVEEGRRGHVVLLGAHFQGFCRDLHTESSQVVASKVRPRLQQLVQNQFLAHRRLDHGNPTLESLEADLGRFGLNIEKALRLDPANPPRLTHLKIMLKWRNAAAHGEAAPAGGIPLDLPRLRLWRDACDGLATALDTIMYNRLRGLLRRAPW